VKKIASVAALVVLTQVLGCISVPVTATVVTQPGRRVTAEASKLNVLWISPLPPDTSSRLIDELLEQCEGADLTGVTIGTQVGWVIIGNQEKIIATGYCVETNE